MTTDASESAAATLDHAKRLVEKLATGLHSSDLNPDQARLLEAIVRSLPPTTEEADGDSNSKNRRRIEWLQYASVLLSTAIIAAAFGGTAGLGLAAASGVGAASLLPSAGTLLGAVVGALVGNIWHQRTVSSQADKHGADVRTMLTSHEMAESAKKAKSS